LSNARAEQLLSESGIPFEPEPKWIKNGQKPDFYCAGRKPFWCEVKTLERPEDSEKLHKALDDLINRTSNLDATGLGFAYIHDDFSQRDAKNVGHLLKRGLKRFKDCDAPDTLVALVPLNPDRQEFVRVSLATKTHGTAEFHSCVSRNGTYGSPDGIHADPFDQQVSQTFSTGARRTLSAGAFLRPNETFLVALVVQKHPENFALVSAAPALPAKRLKTPERIREVLSDANDQFKNGIKFKDAACLLIIFHDGLDAPDDAIIASALYGNLKFTFPEGQPDKGKFIFDKDGGWTPEKNRTTSAVLYVRKGGEPLLVHNCWAHRPFPTGMFFCREISLLPTGSFQEVDFAGRPAPRSVLTRIARIPGKLIRFLAGMFNR